MTLLGRGHGLILFLLPILSLWATTVHAQTTALCERQLLGFQAHPISTVNTHYSSISESRFVVRIDANSAGWIRGMHPRKVGYVVAALTTYRLDNGYKTVTLRFERNKGYPPQTAEGYIDDSTGTIRFDPKKEKYAAAKEYIHDLHRHAAQNWEKFVQPLVLGSVAHAKRWYPRRNWSEEFLDGMEATAEKHLWYSSYIAVIREIPGKPDQ